MNSIVMCGYSVHQQCDLPGRAEGNRYYLIRLQTQGNCGACLNDGEWFTLEKGDLLTLEPGDRLRLKKEKASAADGDVSGDYYLMCQGEWTAGWYREIGGKKLTRIPPCESLLELWRLLIQDSRRSLQMRDDPYLESLFRTFCLLVKRQIEEKPVGEPDFIVSRMRRYIENHAVEKLRVADVAAQTSLSESRAAHLFKEVTGSSIVEYLMKVRLDFAIEQMKYSNATLEEIAENSGFGAYSYFHRIFKRATGHSPGEFRKRCKGAIDWNQSTKIISTHK